MGSAFGLASGIASNTLRVALWDDDLQSYPARPVNVEVVRFIGPIEPTDWTDADEWRTGYGTLDPDPVEPDTVSGLIQYMTADALSLSDGDAVGTWTASIGNNATQATAGNKPTFKTGIVNSLPIVRFDGSNDFLSFSALGVSLSQFTIFAVLKSASLTSPTEQVILSQDASGFSNDLLFGLNPEDGFTASQRWAIDLQSNGTRLLASDTTAPSTSGFQVVAARYDGSTLEIFRDSLTPAASSIGTGYSATDRGWNLGRDPGTATRYFSGDVATIGLYSVSLSDFDLGGVLNGLKDKYGL